MGKLGKALGFLDMEEDPAADDTADEESPASKKEPKAASAETLAMKQFERASTTEAKVQAMKDFLEACGAIGTDEESY